MNKELGPVKLNDMSIEYQLTAVEDNSCDIQHIVNPCSDVQLKSIEKDPEVIYYISNPRLQAQMKAVEQWGCAIQYIDDPCLEVQMKAVEKDVTAILYIVDPCLEVTEMVDTIKTSQRTIYRNKKTGLFSVGCQSNMTKDYFIWRIYNTEGGLEKNSHRQEYLDILERY